MAKNLQELADLTRAYTVGLTPEQIIDVAMSCAEEAAAGRNDSIWHNVSLVLKTRCHCAPCNPTAPKGRFAYKQVA